MSTYPAISLHQPWATLIATRQPCGGDGSCLHGTRYIRTDVDDMEVVGPCSCSLMVKRFETRSRPCPPKYIGQRVAIHAAKRTSHLTLLGPGSPPLVVGDWTVALAADGRWGAMTGGRWVHLPLGAVVATAVITASLPIYDRWNEPSDAKAHICRGDDPDLILVDNPDGYDDDWKIIDDQLPYGDWTPGRFAWELADVEPLAEPVPWKGRQGWFTVELP